MSISIFDLFSIGLGPSSSHTVGPMRAARNFLLLARSQGLLEKTTQIQADLFGSLALTGKGHGTDKAILLGLLGETPEDADPTKVKQQLEQIEQTTSIHLLSQKHIQFNREKHLVFHYKKTLPHHANGMRFTLFDSQNRRLLSQETYSVGGGFVVNAEDFAQKEHISTQQTSIPYPFLTAKELLGYCQNQSQSIREIIWQNERTWRSDHEIERGLRKIWQVMQDCIDSGCAHSGILPGGLKVKRRAAILYQKLKDKPLHNDPMNWVNLYALAVNEENAAGGRVVTAPTNGAAGIIPAVLKYYTEFCDNPTEDGIFTFLLTAGAVGILFKEGASISAAEVGCQGEVGVACSMAAAGLCAALGGNIIQVENAAEIGMEHHLGLTCDPVGGLVQIPCIERNAMGAVQAINIAKLSLMEDDGNRVSLDQVIKTMRDTGRDMQTKYKETAQGGLAVHLPAC